MEERYDAKRHPKPEAPWAVEEPPDLWQVAQRFPHLHLGHREGDEGRDHGEEDELWGDHSVNPIGGSVQGPISMAAFVNGLSKL